MPHAGVNAKAQRAQRFFGNSHKEPHKDANAPLVGAFWVFSWRLVAHPAPLSQWEVGRWQPQRDSRGTTIVCVFCVFSWLFPPTQQLSLSPRRGERGLGGKGPAARTVGFVFDQRWVHCAGEPHPLAPPRRQGGGQIGNQRRGWSVSPPRRQGGGRSEISVAVGVLPLPVYGEGKVDKRGYGAS